MYTKNAIKWMKIILSNFIVWCDTIFNHKFKYWMKDTENFYNFLRKHIYGVSFAYLLWIPLSFPLDAGNISLFFFLCFFSFNFIIIICCEMTFVFLFFGQISFSFHFQNKHEKPSINYKKKKNKNISHCLCHFPVLPFCMCVSSVSGRVLRLSQNGKLCAMKILQKYLFLTKTQLIHSLFPNVKRLENQSMCCQPQIHLNKLHSVCSFNVKYFIIDTMTLFFIKILTADHDEWP